MFRRMRTFLILFCVLAFVGTISLTHISVAGHSSECACQSGDCKCGKDCQCEHCATGKGKCACKSVDGKCNCGKDCKCEHCTTGKGKCTCNTNGNGCKCGKDCKCSHCVAAAGAKENSTSDTDYATLRTSKNGIFKVLYTAEPAAIPVNQIHSWKLKIETADGKAVKDAEIAIEGTMPEHGHGLPTQPKVTKNFGDGTYLVEGIKFSMPGWWVMTFQVKAEGKNDSVTFNLQLK